ncbi:MAG: right-handed parallel beta-helix repeat-containing protein [Pyrinomonadaceae bacterium]|nr:right-handed parallel beta-helix repeat-containing protein [Pyrinomonadaceae bacterium]
MNQPRITFQFLTLCLLLLAATSFAQAQATRTWVSGTGDDVNPCSRTAPCKTFNGAIAKTAAFGEISVLDPGGFGALTITKSVTVNAEGSLGGITAASVNGIVINAAATDTIYLKNLDINGAGSGISGIRYLSGNSVVIEKVRIYSFTDFGIEVNKSSTGFLSVSNSSITNCLDAGITTATSAGTVRVDVENTKAFGCTVGFKAGANTEFTVKSSTAIGCGTAGFQADGATAEMNLDSCVATNNGNGVQSRNAATIRIGACTVSNNIVKGLDISIGLGVIETYRDNYIRGNPASDVVTGVTRG